MIIRPALFDDIDRIVDLSVQLLEIHRQIDPDYYQFESDYTAKLRTWAEQQLNIQSQFLIVATDEQANNQVIGYISGYIKYLFPWFKTKSVGHISFLCVLPAFQKNGVGRKLEEAAVEWSKTRGINYIEVYTNEKNEAGLSAWNAYGYSPFHKFLRKRISP